MWNDSSVWRSKCANMATTCWWILSKKTTTKKQQHIGHMSVSWHTFLGLTVKQCQHLHAIYGQNRGFRVWQHLHMEYNECTITQYMKIYGSIHIHSCYKLTAYLNNLHFMQVWKYHLWADLLHPWGSEGPHHSSCIVNIPHDNTSVMLLVQMTLFRPTLSSF